VNFTRKENRFASIVSNNILHVGAKFVHVIWNSHSYDMVGFQDEASYGEAARVKLDNYDVVKFAEAFGCKGINIQAATEISSALDEAFKSDVPVLINIPADYSMNLKHMQDTIQTFIN
jgi:acetolactate synthase-1/2/3 large subunit